MQLLVAHDPGRHDLAEALVEATKKGKRAEFAAQVRHAIAVAESEAKTPPEKGRPDQLQWFTGAIFAPRNFRRLAAAPAPLKQRKPPIRAPDQQPRELSEASLAETKAVHAEFMSSFYGATHETESTDEPTQPRRRKAAT